jgi:hypothetical protein
MVFLPELFDAKVMNDFGIWFSTGVEHILNVNGFDHILFVVLLVFAFPFEEWRKLILVITAFTFGHSLALAASVLTKIPLPTNLIEVLIAFTILATAAYEASHYKSEAVRNFRSLYFVVLFFGLIHGLGFSFALRGMLGREEIIILPLLYFNLGLELGQLIIVAVVLLFSLLLARLFHFTQKKYKLFIVCIIAIIAVKITAERLLQLF